MVVSEDLNNKNINCIKKGNRNRNRNKKIYNNIENMNTGEEAIILSEPKNLSLLSPLGIRKGKLIKVLIKQPFGGPIVVLINGRQIAISRHIAKKIYTEIVQ